jgi:transcriptional regulator with XRE-family HTH domain
MNYKKESGERLALARKDKKMTLEGLSRALSGFLSPSRLSNYEQGIRKLGIKEALALSKVLGVNASYLLCLDEEVGEMTSQENALLRNFRALPEKDRNEYSRRIEVLAMAYREPVPDERLSQEVRKGPTKSKALK